MRFLASPFYAGRSMPVNKYPGPLLDTWQRDAELWEAPMRMDYLLGGMPSPYLAPPFSVLEQRDRNAGWGMWPHSIRLPHVPVHYDGLWVPAFDGDPERAVWTRRKWWGRGPIVFDPWGLRRGAVPVPWRSVRTGEIVWGEVLYAPRCFEALEQDLSARKPCR